MLASWQRSETGSQKQSWTCRLSLECSRAHNSFLRVYPLPTPWPNVICWSLNLPPGMSLFLPLITHSFPVAWEVACDLYVPEIALDVNEARSGQMKRGVPHWGESVTEEEGVRAGLQEGVWVAERFMKTAGAWPAIQKLQVLSQLQGTQLTASWRCRLKGKHSWIGLVPFILSHLAVYKDVRRRLSQNDSVFWDIRLEKLRLIKW